MISARNGALLRAEKVTHCDTQGRRYPSQCRQGRRSATTFDLREIPLREAARKRGFLKRFVLALPKYPDLGSKYRIELPHVI